MRFLHGLHIFCTLQYGPFNCSPLQMKVGTHHDEEQQFLNLQKIQVFWDMMLCLLGLC